MHKGTTTKLVTNTREAGEIRVEVGLHQGSALSPSLFIIIIAKTHHGACSLQAAPVLCGERIDNTEETLETWRRLDDVGPKVSKSKAEYLPPKKGSDHIKLKKYNSSEHATLPEKVTFKYLGNTVYREGGCRTEV